jgi:uncharacterized protein (TIGR02246 family)
MRKQMIGTIGAVAMGLSLASGAALAGDGDANLVEIEKSLWAGWAAADSKPFEKHLAKEGVNMVPAGFTFGKDALVKDMGSSDCKVASYSLGEVKVIRPADKVAILTYSATQDAVCGDYRPPAKIHATSVYVKKDGEWKNAVYAETPTSD